MKSLQLSSIVPLLLALVFIALLSAVSVGCNTAHGFGQDVSNTGDAIQRGTD